MQTQPGAQIPIATLPNLRDLGGWPTTEGRRVRRGLLFRSTDLDRLDADGEQAVERLGLRTVVDLRTVPEIQAHPDRLPAGAEQVVCDVMADNHEAAPAQLHKVMASPKDAGRLFGHGKAEVLFEHGYRDIVSLPSALTAFRRFFSTLAAEDRRPVLFHCTTGKDRTGWAAAVTLTILGVPRDDIMQDYLLTNDQLLPALKPILDSFRAEGGDPAYLEPALGVRAEYLEAAFDEVRQRFGSMEGYLANGLGMHAAMQERLRATFTDETAA
jgi:protein-tyrosine phosphatase